MVSVARDNFMSGLNAFTVASGESAVIAGDEVGSFLRRGMTVAAFNLLETFLDDRMQELAAHINGGATQFLDLPERLQRRAILQTLDVANARLRRASYETKDLRNFSHSVGQSLVAVNSSLSLSPFTWLWTGSNVSVDELTKLLSFLQVDKPWEGALLIAGRLGYATVDVSGAGIDLKADLQELAENRHRSAHVASHPVTSLWLRAVPNRILRIAAAVDMMMSAGAHLLRVGDPGMLAGSKWDPASRLKLRFVRERVHDYGEYVEGAKRASRKSADGAQLFLDASVRCAEYEVLVRQDIASNVVNWSVPCVG